MHDEGALAVLKRPASFEFRVPADDMIISCGDYVSLASEDERKFLGQIESSSVEFVHESETSQRSYTHQIPSFQQTDELTTADLTTRLVPAPYRVGEGRILAEIGDGADVRFQYELPSGRVRIDEASDDWVEWYLDATYEEAEVTLPIGTVLNTDKAVQVKVRPQGLKRATGFFGQPGSGKSFALGILLEQLHILGHIDIVVIDPNGDFTYINEPLRQLDEINHPTNKGRVTEKQLDEYETRHDAKKKSTSVLSPDPSLPDSQPLVVRPSDVTTREMAVALGLDPLRDDSEIHLLANARRALGDQSGPDYTMKQLMELIDDISWRSASEEKEGAADTLLMRVDNLGAEEWTIWGTGNGNVKPLVGGLNDAAPKTVVVDVSVLSGPERALVSCLVFRRSWDNQAQRKRRGEAVPTLLFVDEAHHLFPRKPLVVEQKLTLHWGTRIAGEGRKFGLYMVMSSQLPSKIHEHVLTQCGNLVLMKMVSQSDIAAIADSFSFVSEMLLEMANSFHTGEALIVGDIVPAPCLLHFEGRKTQEGGRDLDVDWSEAATVK